MSTLLSLELAVQQSDGEILGPLDPEQRRAVLAGGGLVRVRAGAGTGKTRVLTTRVWHLACRRGVDPARIVAVTFTRKAAREMRERAAALGGEALAPARFLTLHALSARILRRMWRQAGLRSEDFTIASQDDAEELVSRAVDSSGVVGPAPDPADKELKAVRKEFTKLCTRRIGRWKENGLSADEASDPGRPRRNAEDEDCAAVYVAYQRELAERNMLDFGDLTLTVVRMLEADQAALAAEAGAIEWMLVDEFQDTNAIQLRLINLLSSARRNLLVVGDDDQSLYGFRGAIPRLMDSAPALLPAAAAEGLTDVALVTNRRCTDDILGPANLLVDYNRRDEPKVLRSGRDGTPVGVSGHPTDVAEAEAAVARIRELIAAGTRPEEIAVLGRTGFVLEPVAQALARAAVPHSVQAGTAFHERGEVRDVLAYLLLALDPSLDLAFARVAGRPTRGLGPSAVDAVLSLARSRGIPIHEALAAVAALGGLRSDSAKGASTLSRHLDALAAAAREGETSEDMVRFVLDQIGYSEWAWSQKDPPKTLRSSLEGLLDMAREQASFREFVTELSLLADPEEASSEGVHVGTLHGSKGLEWDAVLIIGFEDGVIPSQRAMDEASRARGDQDDPWCTETVGGIEEERRLAHVGLTRARHVAHVSFAMSRGPGAKKRPAKPSRFLREAEMDVPRVTQTLAAAKASRPGAGRFPKQGRSALW